MTTDDKELAEARAVALYWRHQALAMRGVARFLFCVSAGLAIAFGWALSLIYAVEGTP